MKKRIIHLSALGLVALAGVAQASTVTIVDDGSNMGTPGTFYWAITNTPAGGTIDFNIPGAGPHYLQIPTNGFPIIYRQGSLTIDGYTQPGASPNSNPLTASNNAVIKIVIDGRNGQRTDMRIREFGTGVTTVPPINNSYMKTPGTLETSGLTGTGEAALLGVYRSTNVNIRGLAFLGTVPSPYDANTRSKGIVVEMDYDGDQVVRKPYEYTSGSSRGLHINGCWFGVNPTNVSVAGSADQGFRVCITSYAHVDNSFGRPLLLLDDCTIGVKRGSAPGTARAQFNVMAGVGGFTSLDSTGLTIAGNFIEVLPDGVTPFNFLLDSLNPNQFRGNLIELHTKSQTNQLGRIMVIGTDGDGVNDADEGNVFGPQAKNPANGNVITLINANGTGMNGWIVAGNRFGIGNDGILWTNNSFQLANFNLYEQPQIRIGSDFNGVSDDLEANIMYNNNVFTTLFPSPGTAIAPSLVTAFNQFGSGSGFPGPNNMWISFRGNKSVDNFPLYNPGNLPVSVGQGYTNTWNNFNADVDNRVPVLLPSTLTTLNGTFNAPTNNATNCIVDVYLPDPLGQANGALFNYPFFGGLAGEGFVNGKTHLGAFLDNGPYDSNPAVGAFAFDITGLGIGSGTNVTVAVTYSTWARPSLTSVAHSGGSTTLTWTGDCGGPYTVGPVGLVPGATSGFGIQSASSITGPWTTTYAPGNSVTLPAAGSAGFYRVIAPISGMTTLCAIPVTLP